MYSNGRVFAIMIIVAVTITIGFATISWLIGTQSTSTDVELLRIRSSYIYFNETDDSWWIRVRVFNEGSKTAEVKRIEIQGVETIELHPAQVIKPGEENEVKVKLSGEYQRGSTYNVRILSASGTIYSVVVKAD
ncbi:MAG: hypothetical protein QXT75_02595 [Desulfurococcaceae archaeon]